MTTYLPALIWLLSAVVCHVIAERRGLKRTPFRAALVALFGPIAIPFLLVAKPDAFKPA